MKIAALDVDGTLLAGTLAGELPTMLVDAGLAPQDRCARLREVLLAGEPESRSVAEQANDLFAAMLTDVPCRAVSAVAAELWARRRERVFDFVKPTVDTLHAAGYTLMLISGGPEEMVAHLAVELGIDRFRGTRFVAQDDLYTGQLASTVVGVKDKVVVELVGGRPVAWSQSLAIGNSLGDVELFNQVGLPIAFEPSPALIILARDNAWSVSNRHNLPSVLRDRLGVAVPARPRFVPSAVPPSTVREAARRVADHVLAEVGPSGAIIGRCESRVTESALMLTLLRRENLLPDAQLSLRHYLAGRAPSADPFDSAVINSTLYGTPVPDRDRLVDKTFEGAFHHSSARKKLALAAILAAVGPEPFHVDAPSDAFNHRGETTWTRLRLMAIQILNASDPVAPELTARLLRLTEEGQRRGVIEQQTFSHLFALLALNRVVPRHPVVLDGVAHLAAGQNPDGGMPFTLSEEVFATATAGLALLRAGADHDTLVAMADYLATQQASDGGWPFAQDVQQTDVDDTTHVLAFLHALDWERYRTHIAAARQFLCDRMSPDGGMPTYHRGHPSEVTMTANTVVALAPYGWAHRPLLDRAARFLLQAQHPNGTFERSWSLSESNAMFRASHALRAVHRHNPVSHRGRIPPAVAAIDSRLLTTANADGGWGQIPDDSSDPMSTAYSLIALAEDHRDSAVVRAGTRYLLSQQNPDGGYTSVSDQAGPRPLRYCIPVLVNIFVLMAMTYLETVRIRGRSTARAPGGLRALCGEVDLDLGRAAMMGEAWVPAVEAAGQVVVEDSGADLEEELSSGR